MTDYAVVAALTVLDYRAIGTSHWPPYFVQDKETDAAWRIVRKWVMQGERAAA